jgi:hypothetical protein
MKKTFNFGKIDLYGTGRRYPVTVTAELQRRGGEKVLRRDPVTHEYTETGETTPEYLEFTASASIGARYGGQCLDEIQKHERQLKDRDCWKEIYKFWKLYHLNGMHAGTPEQEKAIDEWKAAGNKYDYSSACEYLKSIGLYEVEFSGLTVGRRMENEKYKYGHAWIIQEIPGDDLLRIEHLLSA